jgi:hypothetical protein
MIDAIFLGGFVLFIILMMWAGTLFPECAIYHEALFLNLTIKGPHMAKIGDTVTATIAPTNAAGSFAPVFEIQFSEDSEGWDVASVATDGLSAVLVAVAAGVGGSVTVSAVSKGGVSLSETVALADVDAPPVDEEAVKLNLSVA